MRTPMPSRRHVPTSLKITSEMIKVGKVQHPRPFEKRMKDYETTYKCKKCGKSHFSVIKKWTLNNEQDPNMIERIIGREFLDEKIANRYEYYKKSATRKIHERIDQLLTKWEKIHGKVNFLWWDLIKESGERVASALYD